MDSCGTGETADRILEFYGKHNQVFTQTTDSRKMIDNIFEFIINKCTIKVKKIQELT